MSANNRRCVVVQDVSKKFSRSLRRSFVYGAKDVVRAVVGRQPSYDLRPTEFWALRNISFELEPGRSLGIVGVNGSGKTTLLRIISGIIQPTRGTVGVHGRIAPMLALGAGFQPVLSGRENIFLNLSILGVSQRDIRKHFDSILDFSELHDAIDAPVGTYSSGMRARLGFACAIHTNPSMLIIDEVLSVGDARFRVKCRNHINKLRRAGTSMLLVSHSAVLIESLCDDCMYLRNGKMAAYGPPKSVLLKYEEDSIARAEDHNAKTTKAFTQQLVGSEQPYGDINILSLDFYSGGLNQGSWVCGREGTLAIKLRAAVDVNDVSLNVMIFDVSQPGAGAVQWITSRRDVGVLNVDQGETTAHLRLPQVGLPAGIYRVKLSISSGPLNDILDVLDDLRLVVRDTGLGSHCNYYQPRDWIINDHLQSCLSQEDSELEMEVIGEG